MGFARTFLSALLLLAAPIAQAQTVYPDYSEIHVNDFADLLSAKQEDAIRDDLKELRQETGIEFTVVTIETMGEYGHADNFELFATGLFNDWGVGDAGRNDGVMMLISRFDREMRIEVGSGYGAGKNDPMKAIIDDVILPQFRKDDYAEGIARGVDAVIYELVGRYPGEYGAPWYVRAWNRVMWFAGWLGSWIYAIAAPLLVLPYVAYRRWRRNRPRYCPNDNLEMHRLDEGWDDDHLTEGEVMEEQLKSVDYDVWQCAQCNHLTIEAYRAWFSPYGACRSCKYRTLEGESTIVRAATTTSTGKERIDYNCHNCHDSYTGWRTIPKKSKSSSSSGSFGGGSSSGGGASGSW